jgi:YbbR domain-containing protein
LYFVEKEQKDLPVKLNAQVALSRQYMLVEEPSIQPAFVRVYAPSSILDSLELVETEFLDLPVLRDSVSMDVKLKAIEGVHFDQTSVRVHFPVEEFTEVRYEIPVTGLDFPENLLLRSFPSKVVVSFLVSKSNYQSVKAEDFQLGISYRDLIESNEDLQSVKLIKTPDYVQRLSLHPDKVECLIEKK